MALHWIVCGVVTLTTVAGDSRNCEGIGQPLKAAVARTFRSNSVWGSPRTGRSFSPVDPYLTQRTLLKGYQMASGVAPANSRTGDGFNRYSPRESCGGTPPRLCKTRYNTTAPMYGVSLTSGQPVTIVQKFPDLLQQVVFEVCESNECDVVRGECTQTYVPYLFLVIPLGPVTLTGQDYVLVESGCVCKPKYATIGGSEPSAISAIPQI
ncbi:hypothetical protein Cfor_01386 [Coptotermes formosanus]|uniref:Spaetzle domain-containing protein n=1 Tax=Coptotermes formosanus TaxID=36987 RepID=A0A6L2PUR3_COPFO|nr:hypothetical protein Cfor_01386 [Coptotermes formosanus]